MGTPLCPAAAEHREKDSWNRLRRAAAAALALVLCAGAATKAQDMRSEYEIKAAFLLNFAKFVEFPAGSFAAPDDPLLIGVLGRDPFGSALSNVVLGKIVDRHKINIVRQPSSGSIPPCHILFVSKSESGNLRQTLDQLRGKNVLTVGDSDDFVKSGGMIRLYVEDDRVRFEINPQAAERAGLRISSRLLALARVVAADSGGARN